MNKILLFFIFLNLALPTVFAQNTANKVRLANEYYHTKEFEKAEPLYREIYETTRAKVYFSHYINCLIEQAKYGEAEKEIKKQIRKNKKDISFKVDLGYLYKKQGNDDKAKKEFEKAVESMQNQSQMYNLANAFITRREYDYAEKTYKKASRITGNPYHNELANVYAMQRKHQQMVDEYLDLIEESPKKLDNVQNRLQYYIKNETDEEFSDILRISLLKRVQKNNKTIAFNKMLVWLYLQHKDFKSALMQAKAIDKRINGSGRNVINLAETALANKDYDTALDAYKYVIDKGRMKPYYITASVGRLKVYYEKVLNDKTASVEEAKELEEEYLNTINSLGIGKNTAGSLIDLAHLQTFYLDKPDAAVKLLEQTIAIKGLPYQIVTKCKIELGDALLYQGDIWQAALIYGQAEKENKENKLGDIAKLRKAKLAYYACDFMWAKAQFDALKASTSKEVANDALFYSMLIKDNTEDDSLMTVMSIFARADLLIFRNKNEEALMSLDTILTEYPAHKLADESYLRKSEIYFKQGDYEASKKYLQKIISEWPYDILGDVATYRLAVLYDKYLNNKEEAAENYKKVMLNYPDSIWVSDARKRFREIRKGIN